MIVGLILVLLNQFQKQYNLGNQYFKADYKELFSNKSTNDAIIIGTSHAASGIRPTYLDKTGMKFFNYGTNGANPTYMYSWWNMLYAKNQTSKPKLCVVAIDWFLFNNNTDTNIDNARWLGRYIESDSEYFSNELFFNLLLSNNGLDKMSLLQNRFAFWKYRSQIFNALKLESGDPNYNKKGYDRGFYPTNAPFDSIGFYRIPSSKFDIYSSKEIVKMNMDSFEIEKFQKLISQIDSSGIDIIFVMCPEYGIKKEVYNKMKSFEIFDHISKEYNIPILNFNLEYRSEINDSISYYSDWGHLNSKGSAVFSEKLADLLIENYINKKE